MRGLEEEDWSCGRILFPCDLQLLKALMGPAQAPEARGLDAGINGRPSS
jgi:hypothetical protein